MKISIYLDTIKNTKELIYEMLEDTVTSIRVQSKFLSPFIAAFVGSLTLIIVRGMAQMLQRLEDIMKSFTGSMSGDTKFFSDFINFTTITPPTLFQVLVGIYMVESVVLLSMLTSGVEDGFDSTGRDYEIARNILIAIIVYVIVTLIGVIGLNNLIAKGISSTGA